MTNEEPRITINGVTLTDADAMTIRVALETLAIDLGSSENGLGNDDHGRAMRSGYLAAIDRIRAAMFGAVKP
jgi:hypothetical protein